VPAVTTAEPVGAVSAAIDAAADPTNHRADADADSAARLSLNIFFDEIVPRTQSMPDHADRPAGKPK